MEYMPADHYMCMYACWSFFQLAKAASLLSAPHHACNQV